MLPRATKNAVAGHMWSTGGELPTPVLGAFIQVSWLKLFSASILYLFKASNIHRFTSSTVRPASILFPPTILFFLRTLRSSIKTLALYIFYRGTNGHLNRSSRVSVKNAINAFTLLEHCAKDYTFRGKLVWASCDSPMSTF